MFKLFVLLSMCVAFSLAAPGLLHSSPILTSGSILSVPSVRVVQPILTTTSVVRPVIHGGLGLNGGLGLHGYGWI
ncbi:uncharacterized protein LOC115632612 [Scaptodrosophila lebanonensis]|uniref:Uncharacterized protein LOC115632612 n=1 Tax=Drosophila lebanonensis TaxID=7225 RepID=A0A6J2UBF3_DROLE|nr:uncharacterized protein LOC115632612 [Scaptodrosophila lebanonensis]